MTTRVDDEHAGERAVRAVRRLVRSLYSTGSFGLVLVMIVGTYGLATALTAQWGGTIILVAQIVTVWLALRTSLATPGFRRVAAVFLALAGVAALVSLFAERDSGLAAFVFLAAGAVYVVAIVSIVRHIGYRREVDQETMLGALCAYLMFGMAFAFVYRGLGAAQTEPFFGADGEGSVSQDLFFSFVTLTTTGYGNLVPAGNPGQSLAVLEALVGQLFLVTAVAKVVSAWRPRGWQRSAGEESDAPNDSRGHVA
jgi:Ion channel